MRRDVLARADWLNEARVTVYAYIFVVLFVLTTAAWIALSPGLIDPNGKPIGTDFMTVWSAGQLALAGEPSAAYDYARHFEVQREALPWAADQEPPYYGWHYPPFFMFAAAALALLPYGAALVAWTAATLPVYLAAIRGIVPFRRWCLFALAFPAVFVNLSHGQSGFLTAGLLGLGLLMLETRPVLSGILFGLLAYKPQLGLLLPLVLIVDRRWHAFMAAAFTTLTLSVLSYVIFGDEVWRAFVSSVTLTRTVVLEQGAMGWEKMQSAFAAMRMLGAGIETAYAVQAVRIAVRRGRGHLDLAPARRDAAQRRGPGDGHPAGDALCHGLRPDLARAADRLARRRRRAHAIPRWEKIVLFGMWLLPIVSRAIGSLGLPIGPVALLLFLVLILRRASAEEPAREPIAAQPA